MSPARRGASVSWLCRALLPVLVLACGGDRSSDRRLGSEAYRGPIVLITLSGLRVDTVGALGAETSWTPHLDAFAAEADWVGTTVVASSAPAVSLVSLLTGVSPWQHQVLNQTPVEPRPGILLLHQVLGRAGYRAVARVPLNYDLDRFGLLENFDQVAEIEPIHEVVEMFQDLLEEPVFYWLHLREANVKYERRDAALPWIAGRPASAGHASAGHASAGGASLPSQLDPWRLLPYADPDEPLPATERMVARELFGHEVAWADQQAGEVMAAIKASGSWDCTWVIVTATQGTELGEHDQVLYGHNLGRETIEVPLLIKLPTSLGRSLAVSSGTRTGQNRLWSTLVEAVGGRVSPVHAPSLFEAVEPPIVSELYQRNGVNQFSLLDGDLQLVWSTRFAPAEPEFYFAQLASSGGHPPLTEPAREILGRLKRAFQSAPPFSGPIDSEPPTLRLERWTADSWELFEDPDRAAEMALVLRRKWHRFVDRERSPGEESALRDRSR